MRYIAVDGDGTCWGYDERPVLHGSAWYPGGGGKCTKIDHPSHWIKPGSLYVHSKDGQWERVLQDNVWTPVDPDEMITERDKWYYVTLLGTTTDRFVTTVLRRGLCDHDDWVRDNNVVAVMPVTMPEPYAPQCTGSECKHWREHGDTTYCRKYDKFNPRNCG